VYIRMVLTHAYSHGDTVRMMYKITTRICRYDKDVKICVCGTVSSDRKDVKLFAVQCLWIVKI
jgi:hypothetical protein